MGGSRHDLVDRAAEVVRAVAGVLREVPAEARLVVAVSGGPDSVVLAAVVREARPDLHLTVVHVRHGLRDDDGVDAAAAREAAGRVGADFLERPVQVRSARGVEADAREARYRALAEAAAEAGADWLATGHTADDQAETVLLNVARGAGLRGASGMPARRPLGSATLLRPLLHVRRSAVHDIAERLRDQGATIANDSMNADLRRRRNRARAEALPALQRLTGGDTDPVVALVRLADAAAADDAALDGIAREHLARLRRRWGPVVAVPHDELTALPSAVGARIVRQLASPSPEPGATPTLPDLAAVERVLELRAGASTPLLPGVVASRSGRWLTIAPARAAGFPPQHIGELVPALDVRVERQDEPVAGCLPFWAAAGAASVVPAPLGELVVRPCRRDDTIETNTGRRRLISAIRSAVPTAARPLVAVVADDDGPLWVPGVAVRRDLPLTGAYLRLVGC